MDDSGLQNPNPQTISSPPIATDAQINKPVTQPPPPPTTSPPPAPPVTPPSDDSQPIPTEEVKIKKPKRRLGKNAKKIVGGVLVLALLVGGVVVGRNVMQERQVVESEAKRPDNQTDCVNLGCTGVKGQYWAWVKNKQTGDWECKKRKSKEKCQDVGGKGYKKCSGTSAASCQGATVGDPCRNNTGTCIQSPGHLDDPTDLIVCGCKSLPTLPEATPTSTPMPTPTPSPTVGCEYKYAYADDPQNTPGNYYLVTLFDSGNEVAPGTIFVYYVSTESLETGFTDVLDPRLEFIDSDSHIVYDSATRTITGDYHGAFRVRVANDATPGELVNTAVVSGGDPSECSTTLNIPGSLSCTSLTSNTDPIEYGNLVTFTCEASFSAASNPYAQFYATVNGVGIHSSSNIPVDLVSNTATYDITIDEYGDWNVQCRVCAVGVGCTEWGQTGGVGAISPPPGALGGTCGGIANIPCGSGLICDMPDQGRDPMPDASGTCVEDTGGRTKSP
jgi:hypothetical protein